MARLPKFIVVLMVVIVSTGLWAAPQPPQPTPPPGEAPIPGILYAVLAAIGYGIFKNINHPKK